MSVVHESVFEMPRTNFGNAFFQFFANINLIQMPHVSIKQGDANQIKMMISVSNYPSLQSIFFQVACLPNTLSTKFKEGLARNVRMSKCSYNAFTNVGANQ